MSDPGGDRGGLEVLYVMGAGRSGSTVLDTVLGSHRGAVSAGELVRVPRVAWQDDGVCACGARASACPHWREVRERLDRADPDAARRLVDLSADFSGAAVPRPFSWRRDPPFPRDDRFDDFARLTRSILEAIRAVGDASLVIDSSKDPARCWALAQIEAIDLRVVHLVRDGRGVASSLRRALQRDEQAGVERDIPSRPVWRSALFWAIVNLEADHVRARLGRRATMVRYEDLLRGPGDTLRRLGSELDLDLSDLAARCASGVQEFPVGHSLAGNRLRMAGNVRLRDVEDWRPHLGPLDRLVFRGLAGWMLRRYQYGW